MGENISEDIQQAQAEVPSQTEPLVSERSQRTHKCLRYNCQADFLSEVNLNRHKQVHAKKPQVKQVSFNKAELSKYWDELSIEEATKVISIKEMCIEGIFGHVLCQVIENVDIGSEFYDRANRMKRLLLTDCKNVFACCCYFIEKNMVSSWLVCKAAEATRQATLLQESENSLLCGISQCSMRFTSQINFNRHRLSHAQTNTMDFMENTDAISKYWDNLTCDQIRQIMSLRETKITGVNMKNLHRRMKTFNQDHPLATTAKQLIDILESSEKMSSTEMIAVLEKASENTHFSNDISCCKDDEIFTVDVDKSAPSNNVAIVSYIIERKLVQGWFNSKESVTSDSQGQLVHDKKSEQRISLEKFVRSNKLTKIYKICPSDVFKVLKRRLKMLKKDFDSKIPKKKLKAVFKLASVILTRRGRKCARGFLLCIVKNHREGRSWNGSFELSDMQVIDGQFIISKAANAELTLESASADFKRLWELVLVPFYKNTELGTYPLYFDEFGNDILNLRDPVTDPDGFMKHEKYLALHFAFMTPLSRLTLLISLYKVYDSNRVVPDHAYQPLNQSMSYDWRDDIKTLPILTNVYYFNVNGHLHLYTNSYFHLLKFSRRFGSHDFDHTKLLGVSQMVPDMMVTDLVIGQLLATRLTELVLFIVNHTNMDGRYFRPFQQFESSDDDVFFCVEDDDDDYSAESGSSDANDASA